MHFPEHGLYCITDALLGQGRTHLEQARLCLEGGAKIIQLRDKTASYGQLLPETRAIAQLCRECGAIFIVNDAPRLALD
ncbi:MAG: thiamine phosphate synthase, partial [Candidatus Sumerlaeota bacterium]|nr:thiamine phosphate synthase [Candidatus Sumerlaeota bacterium]